MTKQQRTQDKQIVKDAMRIYKPSETISHDKKGWYSTEIDYRW